jgi:hypothetical protein
MADEENLVEAHLPRLHASTHKSGGADEVRVDELATPTGPLDLNGQAIEDALKPEIYWVSEPNGSDAVGVDGGINNPWATPQHAIDTTTGNVTIICDKVLVKPISISTSRSITIISDGMYLSSLGNISIVTGATLELINIGAFGTVTGAGNIIFNGGVLLVTTFSLSGTVYFNGTVVNSSSGLPSGWSGFILDGDTTDYPIITNGLDVRTHRITNVLDPTSAQDADTQAARNTAISTHAAIAAAHHSKYTDAEAITAAKTIKLDDFATPDDNTDLNATSTYHGLLAKLSAVATQYLNGNGVWSEPIPKVIQGASEGVVTSTATAYGTSSKTINLTVAQKKYLVYFFYEHSNDTVGKNTTSRIQIENTVTITETSNPENVTNGGMYFWDNSGGSAGSKAFDLDYYTEVGGTASISSFRVVLMEVRE